MIASAVALARGPVVESVRQRSAIISFRTTVAGRAFVVLRNGARIDAGTGVDHVVRLTRLTPGMHYKYTVETDSGVVAEGSFRAAPARAARFTFSVVGDFGSGTRNEKAVASMIESWHPDFVLTVGDNAYPLGARGLLDRDIFGPSIRSTTSAGTASRGATRPWSCWTPTSRSDPARHSCVSPVGHWR